MGQEDYAEPRRTLKIGDSGSDVKGLQKAINRTFKNRDLGRRVPNDSKMTKEICKKGALAARMVGVPEDQVKNAEKKDDSHKRIETRFQDLLRYHDKLSDKQVKNGKKFTDKFLKDLEEEAISADSDQINEYFRYSDFNASDGNVVPEYSKDALRRLVVNYLTRLREESGAAVYISSGYRTVPPEGNTNAACGGASQSWHAYTLHGSTSSPNVGVASDHKSATWSPQKVQAFYDEINVDALGYYSNFTHVDNRGYRSRWQGGY